MTVKVTDEIFRKIKNGKIRMFLLDVHNNAHGYHDIIYGERNIATRSEEPVLGPNVVVRHEDAKKNGILYYDRAFPIYVYKVEEVGLGFTDEQAALCGFESPSEMIKFCKEYYSERLNDGEGELITPINVVLVYFTEHITD